jgi:hypothetical protein
MVSSSAGKNSATIQLKDVIRADRVTDLTESPDPFPPTPHYDIAAILDPSFIFPVNILGKCLLER